MGLGGLKQVGVALNIIWVIFR